MRSRSNKRSSSSSNSYASTVTITVFIAVCVFAVWMLNYSNTGVPPQTTNRSTRTATTASTDDTTNTALNMASSEDDQAQVITKSTSNDNSNNNSENPKAFEDNPGDLPDDAIKSDDLPNNSSKGSSTQDQNSSGGGDNKQDQVSEELQDQKEKEISQSQLSEDQTSSVAEHSQQQADHDEQSVSSQKGSDDQSDQTARRNNQKMFTSNGEGSSSGNDQMINSESKSQDQQETNNNNSESRERSSQDFQNDKKSDTADQQQGTAQQGQQQQESQNQSSDKQQGSSSQESQNETSEKLSQTPSDQNKQSPEKTQQDTDSQQKQAGNAADQSKQGATESNSGDSLLGGDNSGIPKESKESKKSWSTQADQSENQKERRKDETDGQDGIYGYTWQNCNVTAGPDYIPCLDNEKALKQLRTTKHFEHRERHCPQEGPTCLVPLPEGYKRPIEWPKSRDKVRMPLIEINPTIWYHNVPHTLLAEVKGHQNWLRCPAVPGIAWGKNTRVILDVGDVLTMSIAPKDEHEAQVQFALERGIPAISAVMGSQRLPFPAGSSMVPWHNEGGMLLLELNRVLRPGGYFVWSATPVYRKEKEDVEIWKEMSALTASMCWEVVAIKNDKVNLVAAAIYRKPTSNQCYEQRKQKQPPMCNNDDDPNAAWYVPLQACMHQAPIDKSVRGTQWPEKWPSRLQTPPYWLNSSQMGIYGKPAPQDFARDYEHWKRVINNTYIKSLGINWSNVRNVMDMRAVYGGFAAALKDLKVWVMNVVNIDSPDTLPIIYERGLFGIYHDWCESFSTYPRTYDLLHADHLFSRLKKRCKLPPVLAEIDRIVRPGGKFIVRDESSTIGEVENLLKSLHWEVSLTVSKNQEGMLSAQKGKWRPNTYADRNSS
ncbi:S-adenosyl-L-methionine-dependent methyltransferases superfamily protein [Prunus dulcis]|uniref:S-adenosyl-L-methionine-dependent methyltransferases superfamily protein n=1 Tax=Prunus dulcis TaxID=3755 RepID=A0A4Y1RW57_PRUDU|nr:S-adenosyl-L-methionine-dependent methyltransferases superfamily protein [Prunus dulcis]